MKANQDPHCLFNCFINIIESVSVTGKGMRHSPIKNGNVTSFFAMDEPRSLSDFYDHFRYEIGEYE